MGITIAELMNYDSKDYYWIFEAGGSGLKITIFDINNNYKEVGKYEKFDFSKLKISIDPQKAYYTCIKSSGFMKKYKANNIEQPWSDIDTYLQQLNNKETAQNIIDTKIFDDNVLTNENIEKVQNIEGEYECSSYKVNPFYKGTEFVYISMGSWTCQVVKDNIVIEKIDNITNNDNGAALCTKVWGIIRANEHVILAGNFLNCLHPFPTDTTQLNIKEKLISKLLLDSDIKVVVVKNTAKKKEGECQFCKSQETNFNNIIGNNSGLNSTLYDPDDKTNPFPLGMKVIITKQNAAEQSISFSAGVLSQFIIEKEIYEKMDVPIRSALSMHGLSTELEGEDEVNAVKKLCKKIITLMSINNVGDVPSINFSEKLNPTFLGPGFLNEIGFKTRFGGGSRKRKSHKRKSTISKRKSHKRNSNKRKSNKRKSQKRKSQKRKSTRRRKVRKSKRY